jgi:hypothetical protein
MGNNRVDRFVQLHITIDVGIQSSHEYSSTIIDITFNRGDTANIISTIILK